MSLFNLFGFRLGAPKNHKVGLSMAWQIDERLASFILVTEVDNGSFFIGELFKRKFGGTPPDFGHCGDARAKDLQAGFRETRIPYLLVRYNKPPRPKLQEELLRQAHAIGLF